MAPRTLVLQRLRRSARHGRGCICCRRRRRLAAAIRPLRDIRVSYAVSFQRPGRHYARGRCGREVIAAHPASNKALKPPTRSFVAQNRAAYEPACGTSRPFATTQHSVAPGAKRTLDVSRTERNPKGQQNRCAVPGFRLAQSARQDLTTRIIFVLPMAGIAIAAAGYAASARCDAKEKMRV